MATIDATRFPAYTQIPVIIRLYDFTITTAMRKYEISIQLKARIMSLLECYECDVLLNTDIKLYCQVKVTMIFSYDADCQSTIQTVARAIQHFVDNGVIPQ